MKLKRHTSLLEVEHGDHGGSEECGSERVVLLLVVPRNGNGFGQI